MERAILGLVLCISSDLERQYAPPSSTFALIALHKQSYSTPLEASTMKASTFFKMGLLIIACRC